MNRIIAIRYGQGSANGPRGMIAIFPTASSINLRSRFGSCANVSASIAARRNAALCVISSPVGSSGWLALGRAEVLAERWGRDAGFDFFMRQSRLRERRLAADLAND